MPLVEHLRGHEAGRPVVHGPPAREAEPHHLRPAGRRSLEVAPQERLPHDEHVVPGVEACPEDGKVLLEVPQPRVRCLQIPVAQGGKEPGDQAGLLRGVEHARGPRQLEHLGHGATVGWKRGERFVPDHGHAGVDGDDRRDVAGPHEGSHLVDHQRRPGEVAELPVIQEPVEGRDPAKAQVRMAPGQLERPLGPAPSLGMARPPKMDRRQHGPRHAHLDLFGRKLRVLLQELVEERDPGIDG